MAWPPYLFHWFITSSQDLQWICKWSEEQILIDISIGYQPQSIHFEFMTIICIRDIHSYLSSFVADVYMLNNYKIIIKHMIAFKVWIEIYCRSQVLHTRITMAGVVVQGMPIKYASILQQDGFAMQFGPVNCGMKLLICYQISMAAPLKFGNVYFHITKI